MGGLGHRHSLPAILTGYSSQLPTAVTDVIIIHDVGIHVHTFILRSSLLLVPHHALFSLSCILASDSVKRLENSSNIVRPSITVLTNRGSLFFPTAHSSRWSSSPYTIHHTLCIPSTSGGSVCVYLREGSGGRETDCSELASLGQGREKGGGD